MVNKDVEMRVVFEPDDDPLQPKGPHIVTVYKVGDDGLAGNGATVEDLDVAIPGYQKGTIWTAAYEENTIQVDVTTEPGYYAVITAVRAGTTTAVPVAQYINGTFTPGAANSMYGKFYMPNDPGCNVDVTVKYIKGTPPSHALILTTVDTAAPAVTGNTATLTPAGMTGVTSSGDGSWLVPDGSVPPAVVGTTLVAPGTAMSLTTAHAAGYSVKSAQLVVNGISTAIVLTNGQNLSLPGMPMADAEVIVTFQDKELLPRPYDPRHSEAYNGTALGGDYTHGVTTGSNPDLSQTSQEGWIQATAIRLKTASGSPCPPSTIRAERAAQTSSTIRWTTISSTGRTRWESSRSWWWGRISPLPRERPCPTTTTTGPTTTVAGALR
jgi:hypothetical protein